MLLFYVYILEFSVSVSMDVVSLSMYFMSMQHRQKHLLIVQRTYCEKEKSKKLRMEFFKEKDTGLLTVFLSCRQSDTQICLQVKHAIDIKQVALLTTFYRK